MNLPPALLPALLSALHLLALGLGLSAATARAAALFRVDVEAALRADNLWGVAALLWLGTGLLRAFAGFEKGTAFYLSSPLFWVKMALFAAICAVEVVPMVGLIRWRVARAKGQAPDTGPARLWGRITAAEIAVVVLIPFVASAMARGIGR